MRRLVLLSSLCLGACVSQAEKDDIANICFARERSGASRDESPSVKAVKMAEFLRTSLKSERWKAFFKKAATMGEGKRTLEIRRAADAAGLASCPMLDEK